MLRSMKYKTGLMLLIAVTPIVIASCSRQAGPDDLPSEVGSDDSSAGVPEDPSLPPGLQGLSAEERVALSKQRYQERLAAHPLNTVSGFVTDSSGKPLEGVRVSIGDTMVVTDEDGAYSATLALGYHLITF